MANEITITFTKSVAKGTTNVQVATETVKWNLDGTRADRHLQTVGTTEELLDSGAITTAGVVRLKNLDSTNYVQFGNVVSGTFYPIGILRPGKIAFFELTSLALYLKANTAACDIEIAQTEAVS